MKETMYRIALTMVPNIGPVLSKNLMGYCGSAEAVFREKRSALSRIPGIGAAKAADILKSQVLSRAEAELDFIDKNQIRVLFFLDEEYPKRLRHFDYSPLLLYYRGSQDLNPALTVGIVGSRMPSEQGKMITEKLIEGLLPYNVVTVSGLAYGVDGCAHKNSVEHHLPTLGVMGSGHDIIYPSAHRDLAKKMMKNGGLLTEFCSQTKPDKVNFPMRNRIIAALSDALIVVESKVSGGSIITAEFANEYNKDVFAVPGRPTDELSRGCNALIKKNKAHLLESIDDLIYIMRWDDMDKKKAVQTSLFVELDREQQSIVDFIRAKKERTIEELIYGLNLTSSTLASQLLALEFKGVVRVLPGKRYILAF
ncbi:MAG: DNA-protecting protein DprA [Saprospiraceae bacterium]|nr:DNA-protecting protein DprA [Saprospiraceae bacterium]